MKPMRIYVAGPLTLDDPAIVKKNIEAAKRVGEQILKLGHHPYVPHTHFSGWDIDIFKYYPILAEHGIGIMQEWADSLFYIAPSKGADAEKAEAQRLGLTIFTDISEIEQIR